MVVAVPESASVAAFLVAKLRGEGHFEPDKIHKDRTKTQDEKHSEIIQTAPKTVSDIERSSPGSLETRGNENLIMETQ